MTHADQLVFHSRIWVEHPVQQHYDARAAGRFLDAVRPKRIIEIGGWRGELAAEMLAGRSWIESWHNVELCTEAVAASVCSDPRYTVAVGETFAWDTPQPVSDALLLSHCAEHMRWRELLALFDSVIPPVSAVYLAAPLPLDGTVPTWDRYVGTHILEVGWDAIAADLAQRGLVCVPPGTKEVRCFAKP